MSNSNALGTIQKAAEDMTNTVADMAASGASDLVTPTQDSVTTGDSTVTGYQLGENNQWGWITLYVVTIVIAVLGNLLFIVACLCTKRTRTTGYYLLMNLSVRDILVSALCIPFTLDSEIIHQTWLFGDDYCICYRFFYYTFLFFLPLTLMFLAYHLFVENCKWNFAGEEGVVPRPWPHTIFIPLIWFFSAIFAAPTALWSEVRPLTEDFYRNEIDARPMDAQVCMQAGGAGWTAGSDYFFMASTLLTFLLPLVLLFIPWWALLVQICACCTRKLRSSEFWLSLITLFLILFYEASRAPFELFNIHHFLTEWQITKEDLGVTPFLPLDESYKAVMKWAVYAPALLHPLLYFTFSPEARHGVYVLFSRCCSCCCSKSGGSDIEVASDDEKGQMLQQNDQDQVDANVPLQSKQEEEM